MRPENLVWVFGTARTGSSWLSAIMGEIQGYNRWHEPLVGHLFGNLYYVRAGRAFIDANWEISLGPGWEPLELNSAKLAYVLAVMANFAEFLFHALR
jgi:hypothetical protein